MSAFSRRMMAAAAGDPPGFWSPTVQSGSWSIAGETATASSGGTSVIRYEKEIIVKRYFEIYGTGFGLSFVAAVVNSSWAGTNVPGSDANGWGIISNNGFKYHNGSQSSIGLSAISDPGTLRIAADPVAGKVWLGTDAGWGGDPGAGTGEAYSGLPSSLWPALYLITASATGTMRGKASDQIYPAPAGFTPLND